MSLRSPMTVRSDLPSPLGDGLHRDALFDSTGQYRYWLTRQWQPNAPTLTLIMLNPSRADHRQNDPTLRRCVRLAQQWQFGSLIVVNLFAYCTASPQLLKQVADPIGQDNDDYLLRACESVPQIALAWGNWGYLHQRDAWVLSLLAPYRDRLVCLGKNLTGQPRHPLYVPRQTQLQPWSAIAKV